MFEINRDRRSRCTNSWSNLTLKCKDNTFVKADAQIEENCRRTMHVLSARVFFPKASAARNWVIRNLRLMQFRNTRGTTLCWMRGKVKDFPFIKLDFLFVLLFSKPILTRPNIASTKNSQEFLASQVSVLRRNKANKSSTSNRPFFSCTDESPNVLW